MRICRLKEKDLDFAFKLTSLEGWGTTKDELRDLLEFSPNSAFVAEINKKYVGMTFTVNYGIVAFIGQVIVIKDYRRQGIATLLMKHAVDYLHSQGVKSILLDAVRAVVPLYSRLGFKPVCKSLRLRGTVKTRIDESVRNMHNDDLSEVFRLDVKYFGCDRSKLLSKLHSRHPKTCKVLERNSIIKGYIMSTPKLNYHQVGPWIVDESETARTILLENIIPEKRAFTAYLGTLESNRLAVDAIKSLGLRCKFHSLRMVHGTPFSHSDGMFAIGGPDRG